MPIAGAVDEHDDVAFSFHADKVLTLWVYLHSSTLLSYTEC